MKSSILCVHQVGKVGSTSVTTVLQRMFPEQRVYQTHMLEEQALVRALDSWLSHPESPRGKLADHLASSVELRSFMKPDAPTRDWWLISLVREPMGRNVSAFFQNLHRKWLYRLSPEGMGICRRVLSPARSATEPITAAETAVLVEELIYLFKHEWSRGLYDRWFDREIRGVFGIDVFAQDFNRTRGCQFYRQGSTRLLLLRLEDLPRVFLPALDEWLAGSDFSPQLDRSLALERERSNDGSTKAYSDLYKSFRENLRIDAAELDAVYGSRVARHFYTAEELATFRSRWKVTPASGEGSAS